MSPVKKAEPVEKLADEVRAAVAYPGALTAEQVEMLSADLDPRRVSTREGGGKKKLSYLETHDVKRNANRIFGFDGWSVTVNELVCLGEEPVSKVYNAGQRNEKKVEGFRVGYRATVTVTVGHSLSGTHRCDTGYGDAIEYTNSRITPHELASKEAVSDAIKRCLSSWGDQFGLVLYGKDKTPDAEPVGQPVPAPDPEPMASKEDFEAMCHLSKSVGIPKDDLATICRTEKALNESEGRGPGYRQSWLDEQNKYLNGLAEGQAAA